MDCPAADVRFHKLSDGGARFERSEGFRRGRDRVPQEANRLLTLDQEFKVASPRSVKSTSGSEPADYRSANFRGAGTRLRRRC